MNQSECQDSMKLLTVLTNCKVGFWPFFFFFQTGNRKKLANSKKREWEWGIL